MSDDFDDFGGFEAADPSEAEEIGAETTPAFLLPTNLIFNSSQPEGSSPNTDAPEDGAARQSAQVSTTSGATPDLTAVDWNLSTQLNWGTSEATPVTKADQPSIGSSVQSPQPASTVVKPETTSTPASNAPSNIQSTQEHDVHTTRQNNPQRPLAPVRIPVLDSALTDLSNQLQLAEMRNKQLNTELDLLRKSHSQTQELHSKQMESLKLSQESSLTQIIKQHESMCKQAVIEQQKLCLTEFCDVIRTELEKYERSHTKQEGVFEEWRLKLESENKNSQSEQLNQLKSIIEEKIDLIKSDISTQFKQELSSLETETGKVRAELKEEVESQKTDIVNQLKTDLQEVVIERVNQQKEEITEILKQEHSNDRQLATEFWSTHSKELLESAEKLLNETLNKHNERLDEYITNKLEADSMQRERQLSAVDVYLDAAKHQLKTLITPETPS